MIRANPVCSAPLAPSSIDHVIDEDTVATRSNVGAVLGGCPIVLGGPFGAESQEESAERLDAFVERGGTAVETALSYQAGRGIAAVGAWIAEHPETIETVVKVGHGSHGQDLPLTAQVVGREVDTARETLAVDGIGVLLLHNDDPARPVGEIADLLLAIVESGRARAVGASNWSAPRLDELVRRLLSAGHRPLASYHRSLAKPETDRFRGTTLPGDDGIFAVVERHELPLLSWSANAGGYFARSGAGPESGPFDSPSARAARERCAALASDLGTDPATVALAWTLARARTWASVGSGSAARIGEAFAATELHLTAEQISRLVDSEPVDPTTHGRITDPR